jgi:uncharacterized integral membrane protein
MKQALKHWKLILAAIGGILAVILILQNRAQVQTNIFWMRVTMPNAMLLATTFLIGFVAGILATYGMVSRKRAAKR